jgi:hypothetical protein
LAQLAGEYERSELELVQEFLRRANAILGGGDGVAAVPGEPRSTVPFGDPPHPESVPEEGGIFRSRRPSRPANRLR